MQQVKMFHSEEPLHFLMLPDWEKRFIWNEVLRETERKRDYWLRIKAKMQWSGFWKKEEGWRAEDWREESPSCSTVTSFIYWLPASERKTWFWRWQAAEWQCGNVVNDDELWKKSLEILDAIRAEVKDFPHDYDERINDRGRYH